MVGLSFMVPKVKPCFVNMSMHSLPKCWQVIIIIRACLISPLSSSYSAIVSFYNTALCFPSSIKKLVCFQHYNEAIYFIALHVLAYKVISLFAAAQTIVILLLYVLSLWGVGIIVYMCTAHCEYSVQWFQSQITILYPKWVVYLSEIPL